MRELNTHLKHGIYAIRDEILTTEVFSAVGPTIWGRFDNYTDPYPPCVHGIQKYILDLILDCRPDAVNNILFKLFDVPEFRTAPIGEDIFEVFWKYFPGRPKNTPWLEWDRTRLLEANERSHPEYTQFLKDAKAENSRVAEDHFRNPALYEVLAASMAEPPVPQYTDGAAKEIEQQICGALAARANNGRMDLIQDIGYPELLRRFSEAAFSAHHKEYLKAGIKSVAEVLRPPLTAERIAEVEESLEGPLPPDVKEIAMVADGFYGGHRFAGGGWGGIESLWAEDSEDNLTWLGYEQRESVTQCTRTRDDGTTYEEMVPIEYDDESYLGNVYICEGATEPNDNYKHLLCPPETWKRFQNARMGTEVPDGEYAIVCFANWTGGGQLYPSMTEWLVGMMMGMEWEVEAGIVLEDSEDED